MSLVIAALVCSQLVYPQTRKALEFGDTQLQQYPASVGAIAWKADGGLGTLWLDNRRSLGEAAPGNRFDLWGAKLLVGAAEPLDPTGTLLVAAPTLVTIESPGIAFNSGVAGVVWLERRLTTTVQFAQGDEDDASILMAPRVLATSAGITAVSVSAAGTGFIVVWTDGARISWERFDRVGLLVAAGSAWGFGSQTLATPLVAGLVDGGAYFAYSSGPMPRSGLFDLAFTTTADAGTLFDTTGALAGLGFHAGAASLFVRDTAGNLLSRASVLAVTTLTPTRPESGCVVSGNEALTGLAFDNLSNGSQVGFLSAGGQVDVVEAPSAEPVAVATSATQGAFLRRVDGLSVVTRSASGPTISTPIELNLAQPTQRGPSVAWLPDAGGFVLAFEERGVGTMGISQTWAGRLVLVQPDGGSGDLGTTGAAQVLAVSPRVVEWDEVSVGVEDQGVSSHEHRLFSVPASFSAPTTIAGRGWRSSTGPPLLQWRESAFGQTDLAPPSSSTLPITVPRCATSLNGKQVLGGWSGSALLFYEVQGPAPVAMTIAARTNVRARGSMCVTRGRGNSEVLLTWSEGDAVRVMPFGATAGPSITIAGATGTTEFENPVATRLGSGLLVVWETPPYTSLGAAFVDDSSPGVVVPVALRSGSDLVRNPTVSSAPGGPALVVWQEFDASPGVGATRVRARLVFPPLRPDGGVDAGLDAGLIDAGLFDAGLIDAGAPVDGGTVDAGLTIVDAGELDAGALDGGQLPPVDAGSPVPPLPMLTFVPSSCGCSGGPGALSLMLLALWATRRRSIPRVERSR